MSESTNLDKSGSQQDVQMARRRALLNSVVKGSAIAASAVPIKTLALTSAVTAGGQICSASGVESVAHSRATGLPTCLGKSPTFFKTVSNWPGYSSPNATCRVGTVTFTQKSTFSTVFGPGSSKGGYNRGGGHVLEQPAHQRHQAVQAHQLGLTLWVSHPAGQLSSRAVEPESPGSPALAALGQRVRGIR